MRAWQPHRHFLPFFLPVLFSRGVCVCVSGCHPYRCVCPPSPSFPSSQPGRRPSSFPRGERGESWGGVWGGCELFAPAVSGHLLLGSVPLGGRGVRCPFLSFAARVESRGLAPRALPPTLPGGGSWGVLGVDTIKRLLLAQQKQRVQRWEAVSRKRDFFLFIPLVLL